MSKKGEGRMLNGDKRGEECVKSRSETASHAEMKQRLTEVRRRFIKYHNEKLIMMRAHIKVRTIQCN